MLYKCVNNSGMLLQVDLVGEDGETILRKVGRSTFFTKYPIKKIGVICTPVEEAPEPEPKAAVVKQPEPDPVDPLDEMSQEQLAVLARHLYAKHSDSKYIKKPHPKTGKIKLIKWVKKVYDLYPDEGR